MATTTTNFGWDIPQSTDLVKDGATAIAALGQDIDTSLVGLKGGTTGQVLSKTSGTDMAFTWVAQDDSNAIQNAIVDAKGDLIAATANDTPARLAVGTNGQILTADSTAATGIKWADAASSGGMTLISTTSLSGTTTLLSSIPSTYKSLRLIINNFANSANGNGVYFRMNNDSTANRHYYAQIPTVAPLQNTAFNNTYWATADNGDNTGSKALIILDIPDYSNTATWKLGTMTYLGNHYSTTTNFNMWQVIGGYNQTSAISSIGIVGGGGTSFTGGTAYLYGVK